MALRDPDLDNEDRYDNNRGAGDPPSPCFCSDCGEEAEAVLEDHGIGGYEFWGTKQTHHDWRWTSRCCGAEVTDIDPTEEV